MIDLWKKIERQQFSPLYLLYGKEDYLIQETKQKLINKVLTPKLCSVLSTIKKLTPKTSEEQHNNFCSNRRMGSRYIDVVEAYRVDTVVKERLCRQAMSSHRTSTIGSKYGTPSLASPTSKVS